MDESKSHRLVAVFGDTGVVELKPIGGGPLFLDQRRDRRLRVERHLGGGAGLTAPPERELRPVRERGGRRRRLPVRSAISKDCVDPDRRAANPARILMT